MMRAIILMTLLSVASAFTQVQTRQQLQQNLLQFLATDLQFSPDQTATVRNFIRQADNRLSLYEAQYFSEPFAVPKMRLQVIMDLGQQVQGILTPDQLNQYPATKQKLFDFLQARYEAGINKEESEEVKVNKEQPAAPSKPD